MTHSEQNSKNMNDTVCTPYINKAFALGEGLVWDANDQSILMTDILKKLFLKINPKTKTYESWSFQEPIGWVFPTKTKNIYLVGLQSGIALFNTHYPKNLNWIDKSFPEKKYCRLNDACIDSHARIWYGSMNNVDNSAKDGEVASYSTGEGLKIHDRGFSVVNGPLISPDEKFMYINDTLEGIIYRYDFSVNHGTIKNKQIFLKFSPTDGFPDGMCFDKENNLWVAMWGSGCIMRIHPNGNILKKIHLPAPNITNICFFGKDNKNLLVSSASIGIKKDEINKYPFAGYLFEIKNHDTQGIPTHTASINNDTFDIYCSPNI